MRIRRTGFTLVELLVVIAVIGVLVSLLLPAAQAAREAARRMQCMNNQKQLALAVLNYEDIYKVLPPSGIAGKDPSPWCCADDGEYQEEVGKQISWIVFILPQMEQQGLHDSFDFDLDVFSQTANPQATRLTSLLCPSDYSRGEYFEEPSLTHGKRFAKGNYAAWVSPHHTDQQYRWPGALGGDGLRLSRATDGLSNIMMISEVRTRDHLGDQRGAWALPWTASSILGFDMHDEHEKTMFRTRTQFTATSNPLFFGAQPPNNLGPNLDQLRNCPNPADAQLQKMPCDDAMLWYSAAPRSGHPGGVVTVYMDGHTAFIPNYIDHTAMSYLISIDDGQAVEPKTHTF